MVLQRRMNRRQRDGPYEEQAAGLSSEVKVFCQNWTVQPWSLSGWLLCHVVI
jgi:hypothetical protein